MTSLVPFLVTITELRRTAEGKKDGVITKAPDKIRIAVLDSGVDGSQQAIRGAMTSNHIVKEKSKSFVNHPDSWREDPYGHGTHITQLLIKMTTSCAEIYVGKVCTEKQISAEEMPGIAKVGLTGAKAHVAVDNDNADAFIAQAIDWAVKECNADIISISFGYEEENDEIDTALENAINANKLIIAAASNNGGVLGRSRPARREGVMCIHATDGKGNKGKMNPSPIPHANNFATLGVAITSRRKGEDIHLSGTSFAVPVAVGLAANILDFVALKRHQMSLKRHHLKGVRRENGMEAIFRAMSVPRDKYDFVHPNHIWGSGGTHVACKVIKGALDRVC